MPMTKTGSKHKNLWDYISKPTRRAWEGQSLLGKALRLPYKALKSVPVRSLGKATESVGNAAVRGTRQAGSLAFNNPKVGLPLVGLGLGAMYAGPEKFRRNYTHTDPNNKMTHYGPSNMAITRTPYVPSIISNRINYNSERAQNAVRNTRIYY